MATISRQCRVARYHRRLAAHGLVRFEVIGRKSDRDLIRTLAKHLAGNDAVATDTRAAVTQALGGESTPDKLSGPNDSGSNSPRVTVRRGPSGPQM